MIIKDYCLIVLGFSGWLWGIVQFRLNRRYQKIDKKFEVYTSFMNQMDEISSKMRKDPQMLYGFSNDLLSEILVGDEARTNAALLKFNSELLESVKTSIISVTIINQELNRIKLVASKKLLPKIQEYKVILNDFNEEFQSVLNDLSVSMDYNEVNDKFTYLGQSKRAARMLSLYSEIETLMREELGV